MPDTRQDASTGARKEFSDHNAIRPTQEQPNIAWEQAKLVSRRVTPNDDEHKVIATDKQAGVKRPSLRRTTRVSIAKDDPGPQEAVPEPEMRRKGSVRPVLRVENCRRRRLGERA